MQVKQFLQCNIARILKLVLE